MDLRGGAGDIVADLERWLHGPEGEPLVIETSGSSGTPKRVVLSREAVLASVRATERRLGGSGRWLLALPPTYVAGAQVICRSLVAGEPPVRLEEHGGLVEAVRAAQPEFVSVVSTQLHRMLSDPDQAAALRSFRTVLVGGGPFDPDLRARAEAAGVRVVATYGSAETAGGCVYDGYALDGVALGLDAGGRLRVSGPVVFDRYDGDADLTREVLVDGWFLTSDAARIEKDGRLHVLGRIDDVVLSGGVNVPAPAVASRLRAHPHVEEVEVLGVPDPEWGARLVAFVVGDLSLDDARSWVADAHPRSWSPRELVHVAAIPVLRNGKPDRVALRALVS